MFKVEGVSDEEWKSAISDVYPDPKRVVIKDVYHILKKKGIYVSVVSMLPELGYNKSNQLAILKKLSKVDEQIKSAFESSFYLEWLSLLLIKSEFWLRVYLYNQDKYIGKNVLSDGLSFGSIINECRQAGMKNDLVKKIKRLNSRRIQYIHNYLKDDFEYEEIKNEITNFELIVKELEDFCRQNAIRIIQSAEELDNVVGFIRFVKFVSK